MRELGLNDQDGQKSAISRTLSVTFLIHVPHVLLLAPAILVAGNSDPFGQHQNSRGSLWFLELTKRIVVFCEEDGYSPLKQARL